MRAVVAFAAAAFVAALAAAPAAAQIAWSSCGAKPKGFQCTTVPVPLDHSGQQPGTLGLKVARTPAARAGGILIALSGGPGQASVSAATSFATTLQPALRRYQLVVLDQRGSGQSGVLDCPALQPLPDTVNYTAQDTADCANLVGPDRRFYRTIDSADDLETLRQALGVDKIALQGTSYGTFVAEQYAARYPDHVDRLILDSVVPVTAVDNFTLSSFQAVGRVLTDLCAEGRCDGITPDASADTAALVSQLATTPVSGVVLGPRARRIPTSVQSGEDLFGTLVAGDLNPVLRAAYPGVVRSELQGDRAPLLRLFQLGQGSPPKVTDLSAALNVVSLCQDTRMPFGLSDPLPARQGPEQAAEAGIDPNAVAPFDKTTVIQSSISQSCILFPETPTQPVAPPASLPNVPVLVLSGDQDLRTPNEDAKATAALFPQSSYVQVPGNGHDELGGDITGCAREALTRFVGDRTVGDPCQGLTNLIDPLPVAPTRLTQVPPIRGTGGIPGRSALAALATVDDVTSTAVIRLFNGESALGWGGLRSGYFTGSFANRTGITTTLHADTYVPGIRVSGHLQQRKLDLPPVGTLRVAGGRRGSGSLKLASNGTVSGTIGGKSVKVRTGVAASAARAGGGLTVRQLIARLPRRAEVIRR
ncbi:MAG TPA: alpha/beta fold hydrolase [Solirubrobacteraceae bacterium]|jgi:pimeloyl-ACP methyl ester carboxylesterase|nr:alpha/beta fold hydrolase [Solirubrobacteraceae bacterium]